MSDPPNPPSLSLIGAQVMRLLDEMRDQRLRLDLIEARFGALESRFSGIERRLDGIERRLDVGEQRTSAMLAILTRIAARIEQPSA